MTDKEFHLDSGALRRAAELLLAPGHAEHDFSIPDMLPESGLGSTATLEFLAPVVVGGAAPLGSSMAFAHMDPPTPWIASATALWNAALNQNLLHPDLAPVARTAERRVVQWLAPYFGMDGGHMTPGSTLANLTALWAARETAGVTEVVASSAAHISVPKAAHVLGLDFTSVACGPTGCLDPAALPGDLSHCALVLTAGSTSSGAIDPLEEHFGAAWTHVDAAWSGSMALTDAYRDRLNGLSDADSVAVSAHKWMFQPKESALILFRDSDTAEKSISFGADYLAAQNVGLLGSHGACAVPLLATLLAWGRSGMGGRIERLMRASEKLHAFLQSRSDISVFGPNLSGVVLWRSEKLPADAIRSRLPPGAASVVTVRDRQWLRHVAANPNVDIDALMTAIDASLQDSATPTV